MHHHQVALPALHQRTSILPRCCHQFRDSLACECAGEGRHPERWDPCRRTHSWGHRGKAGCRGEKARRGWGRAETQERGHAPALGGPRILGWVAYPFSSRSSRPRDGTHVSYVTCIGRWFFTTRATWDILSKCWICQKDSSGFSVHC